MPYGHAGPATILLECVYVFNTSTMRRGGRAVTGIGIGAHLSEWQSGSGEKLDWEFDCGFQ